MEVVSNIKNYTLTQACSLTIGTFDGVHLGHRKIIQRLVSSAKDKNLLAVVLTFFPHPRMVLQPDSDIRLIDTLEEKKKILASLGVDVLVIHPFSKSFSRQSSSKFIRDVLVEKFKLKHLIIGYDHRFGRNREATVEDLIQAGETYNFEVEKIEAQEIESVNVSSTKVRNALENGDIEKATEYLQRPFKISGKVIEGNGLGRTIYFPTANILIEEDYKLLPRDGVYFIQTSIQNTRIYGMMNIGFRPTVEGKQRNIEVHLFDFSGDLYGHTLEVEFIQLLRTEIKFNSLEELKNQLLKDKAKCEELIPLS